MPRVSRPKAAGQVRGNETWVSGGNNMDMELSAGDDKIEDMDTTVDNTSEGSKKKPHWLKVGPDGKAIRKKADPAKRNAMFRKHLQPKTAVMCLNELVSGLKYNAEPLAPIGSFSASVEVNGSTYRGYGSSKALAKQAAAEAALVSFVKPPPAADDKDAVDDTPWKTVASFALYKLFAEWSEGSKPAAPPAPAPSAVPDLRNYLSDAQQQKPSKPTANGTKKQQPAKQQKQAPVLQPAKKIADEHKINNHPVMVLTQLCPSIKYNLEEKQGANDKEKSFTMSAEVEGNIYSATGPNSKKTKFALAKVILKQVWGINNVFEAAK